ncbi:MAG TPA: sigma-70 family RNA polymerase sigma factor [Verrucomicrobiae bacterium]|nr:sigma-70 family RNA polymerase sigma factor [Verrucomicrobiae bacterium]
MTGRAAMGELSDDSIPTRASLLGRLKNWDDQASWEDFARTYSRLIRGFAIQSGLTEAEAKEVEQETLLCVAKTIHQFESNPERGTFKAWLLKLTRWRIADQFRKRPPQSTRRSTAPCVPEETPTIEKIPADSSQDALWDAEWRKNILETAIARAGRRVNPKHYQVFDLYAVRKWSATKVAKEMGITVVQVYLIYHRLTKQVRKEVQYLESKLD